MTKLLQLEKTVQIVSGIHIQPNYRRRLDEQRRSAGCQVS